MTNITILVLLTLIIIFSVILFLATISLFYQKYEVNHALNKQLRYLTQHKDDWYEHLINDCPKSVTMIPKSAPQYHAVEMIFLSYLKNYHTTQATIRIYDFASKYLTHHYEKQLLASKWSTKMNALYRIYDFRMTQLLPICEKFPLHKLDIDMLLQLFKIYATLKPDKLLEFILAPSRPLSEMDYRQLFMLTEPTFVKQLIQHFDQLETDSQIALVDTLKFAQKTEYTPFLVQLLQSENLEIRIRTLKALYQLSHAGDLTIYEPFTYSPVWEERLMIAKILRLYAIEESFPLLQHLLEDIHYDVRSEASQTFIHTKNSERLIKAFLATSTDTYAINMVKSTLDQKGLGI